ncbi:MAG: hypothetical protein INH41_30305 [Myxococcaceae bacterium]|jgi:hypothetical protein|nr:hypothetical protein [Myxococcaceae bacterium]
MRALLVTWAVGAVGCSGLSKVVKPPPQPLQLTTLFVLPPRLSGADVTGGRQFELAQRACDRVVSEVGDVLAVYGPTEFKVLKLGVPDAWVATDAVPTLVRAGSRPDQGATLELFIERRLSSAVRQLESSSGQARGSTSTEETTWLVRAELSHPSSRTTLVELGGQVTVDPFEAPSPEAEWDEAPPLTALLDKVVAQAAEHARQHAAARIPAPRSNLTLVATPASASLFSASAASEGADALQRELTLQNRARVLAPGVSDAQAATLARALPGTAVLSGRDGQLAAGDVVLNVDRQPALPQSLSRLRLKGVPATLEVKRADGSTVEVAWP